MERGYSIINLNHKINIEGIYAKAPLAQCGYSCRIYGQNKGFEKLFCEHQVELLARKYCMWHTEEWSPTSGLHHPSSGKYKAAKKG